MIIVDQELPKKLAYKGILAGKKTSIAYLKVSLHVVKHEANVGFVSERIEELQRCGEIMRLYSVIHTVRNDIIKYPAASI